MARVVRPSWNELMTMDWPMAYAVSRQLPLLKDDATGQMVEIMGALIARLARR